MLRPGSGAMVKKDFFTHTSETNPNGGPKTCYYDAKGRLLYNQQRIDGYWYMFRPGSGAMVQNSLYSHDSTTNPVGGAKTCYYDPKGHLIYGQRKINGFWYMFRLGSGAMVQNSLYSHDSTTNPVGGAKTCYYDPEGRLIYGQRKINGFWYMFRPGSGAMVSGWFDHTGQTNPIGGDKRVYYDAEGRMVYGKQQIGGMWYRFHESSGALLNGRDYIVFPLLQEGVLNAESGKTIRGLGGFMPTDTQIKELQNALDTAQSSGKTVGFMLVDIETGKGIAYNADDVFYSASTVKGPYVAAMTYFYPESLASQDARISNVLVNSNNEAYFYLHNRYGNSPIVKWAEEAGASGARLNTGGHNAFAFYSARDLAKLWMLNYSYFQYDETGKKVASTYERALNSSIRTQIDGQYTVRSKAGWCPIGYPNPVYNDAGIVYAGNKPYVLAVLSNVPSGNKSRLDSLFRNLISIHGSM